VESPLCFESFQFIKENYHAVYDQVSSSLVIGRLEDDQNIIPDVLPLVLRPQRAIEYQIEEDLEATAYDQMIQEDPLPLCFQSSELFKEEEEEKPAQINQVPNELVCNELQVSFHVLHDASADKLNVEINQCSSPLEGCKVQYQIIDDFPIPKHNGCPKLLYSSLFQPKNCIYMLQDNFVQCVNTAKEVSTFLIFLKINKATSDCKISVFLTSKHKQQSPLMFLLLKWRHWLFHFT